MRDIVQHFDFERVLTGRKSRERQAAIQSDLFAFARDGAGTFYGTPDLLFVAEEAIGCGNTGFAEDVIGFEIIELEEDAENFGVRKGVRKARTNFVRAENELAGADFASGHGFDFVREDESAGIQDTFFILRDTQRRADDADVSGFYVFHDNVKAIEAGMKRDCLLEDGGLVERFLE